MGYHSLADFNCSIDWRHAIRLVLPHGCKPEVYWQMILSIKQCHEQDQKMQLFHDQKIDPFVAVACFMGPSILAFWWRKSCFFAWVCILPPFLLLLTAKPLKAPSLGSKPLCGLTVIAVAAKCKSFLCIIRCIFTHPHIAFLSSDNASDWDHIARTLNQMK